MTNAANATLDQTPNTADAQSYLQLLSSGRVTDHAANEVDEAQANAARGAGSGATAANSHHGRSDLSHDGHSQDGSILNFSAMSPADNTAASMMADSASSLGSPSPSEYHPEQVMSILAQALNPQVGQANGVTPGAQSADTTAASKQPSENSSTLGNLDFLQIATDGLSEFSQGFQQLSQADSTNSQAPRAELPQALSGLQLAQLGLAPH